MPREDLPFVSVAVWAAPLVPRLPPRVLVATSSSKRGRRTSPSARGLVGCSRLMPATAASVLIGAPTALLGAGIWRGFDPAARRWTGLPPEALPGMVARRLDRAPATPRATRARCMRSPSRWPPAPVAYLALDAGHPEDLLAAAAATPACSPRAPARRRSPPSCSPSPCSPSRPRCSPCCPPRSRSRAGWRRVIAARRRRRSGSACCSPPQRVPPTRPASAPALSSAQVWWPLGVPSTAGVGRGRPRRHHLARLAGADPAPADRRARALPLSLLWWWRARQRAPDARTRSRCSRCSPRALPARPVEPRLLPPAAGARAAAWETGAAARR